jgi:GH35 family endo-1,4-beta-xylanase
MENEYKNNKIIFENENGEKNGEKKEKEKLQDEFNDWLKDTSFFQLKKAIEFLNILTEIKEKNICIESSALKEKVIDDLSHGLFKSAEEIISFAKKHKISFSPGFSGIDLPSLCQKALEKSLGEMSLRCAREIIDFAEEKGISLLCHSAFQKTLEYMLSRGVLDYTKEIIAYCEKKKIPLDFNRKEVR